MDRLRDNKFDALTSFSIDFHQRRITNAADAIDAQDYVTLKQLKALRADLITLLSTAIPGGSIDEMIIIAEETQITTDSFVVTTAYPPLANQLLVKILVQDGTGGHDIIPSASFNDMPTNINGMPNGKTIMAFFLYGGKWQWFGNIGFV